MSYKRRRSRKPITLKDAKLRMTDGIKALEKIILEADDENKVIQAVNAMSGVVSRYTKLVEVTDLEERIEALEERMQLRKVS